MARTLTEKRRGHCCICCLVFGVCLLPLKRARRRRWPRGLVLHAHAHAHAHGHGSGRLSVCLSSRHHHDHDHQRTYVPYCTLPYCTILYLLYCTVVLYLHIVPPHSFRVLCYSSASRVLCCALLYSAVLCCAVLSCAMLQDSCRCVGYTCAACYGYVSVCLSVCLPAYLRADTDS
ncbi:hypothetical protein F4859DRAFT_145794 [Xylaria cf. heliscus]|nr:hypothetical protein F4859DRAFT_145794 [Xylaria cf. heliscus]